MTTVTGKYVRTFAGADMGMLDKVSLNAPYPFFWVYIQSIEGDEVVCTGGGLPLRLPFRRTTRGDIAEVTIQDPIFGPQKFNVLPFLQG